MTNKKVFVTGKMTLTVSRTQTLSFLDKSCAVRSCIHHKLNVIQFTFEILEMDIIIYQNVPSNLGRTVRCYSYSTFEDALHSIDVVIEASLAK